jgi:anti-anti-sigma factor
MAIKLDSDELSSDIRVLKLTGKLDNEGTNSIEREFIQRCSGDGLFVLVDLARMTYLSSIGIPLLVNAAKTVAGRGGRLALVGPPTNVKAVLEMTGVTHMIRVYKDLATAQARVKAE